MRIVYLVMMIILTISMCHADALEPLAVNNRAVGGTDFYYDQSTGEGQQGVTDGYGLNNIGLLIKTFGVVTYVNTQQKFMYIDDGSGLNDGNGLVYNSAPVLGVRVSWSDLALGNNISGPSVNEYVTVVGIASVWTNTSGELRPCVKPRENQDIEVISP